MTHALIVEGSDPQQRHEIEASFEPSGHDMRASVNETYKRATWGRRPEDIAAQQAVVADMSGQRTR